MRSVVKHTLAALVVAAIPTTGFAQSQTAQGNPAAEHLAAARAALNKVLNAPAPSGDAFKNLADLKSEYIALEKSASTASPEWATHYANIDRLAGELIGAPAASGESGAVGTSGSSGAMSGVDSAMAANLSTFRTELKAFSTAMSAVAPPSGAASSGAAASPRASSAGAASPPSSTAAASQSATASSAAPSTTASGSVVSGTAPKSTPIPAPATPVSASGTSPAATPTGTSGVATGTASGAPATGTSPVADAGIAAQIDPVIALLDAALAGNPVDASGKVTVDRATLDAIKAQLQVIKAKKQ